MQTSCTTLFFRCSVSGGKTCRYCLFPGQRQNDNILASWRKWCWTDSECARRCVRGHEKRNQDLTAESRVSDTGSIALTCRHIGTCSLSRTYPCVSPVRRTQSVSYQLAHIINWLSHWVCSSPQEPVVPVGVRKNRISTESLAKTFDNVNGLARRFSTCPWSSSKNKIWFV